jgi:hypothetical protein
MGTSDRGRAEAFAAQRGWRIEWGEFDTLHLWQDIVEPIRPHPVTGEPIWLNQAHFFSAEAMIEWAISDGRHDDAAALQKALDRNPQMLDRIHFADTGDPVPAETALELYAILKRHERRIPLQRGDVLALDNWIQAHGRGAYSGDRRVLVALADDPTSCSRSAP